MGTYEELKNAIADVIKTNGNNEISGAHLQNVLKNIVSILGANATFAGIATPSTNPGTPDQNIFYFATDAGTYVNFNNVVVNEGEAAILTNKTGSWEKKETGFVSRNLAKLISVGYNVVHFHECGYVSYDKTLKRLNNIDRYKMIVIPVKEGEQYEFFSKHTKDLFIAFCQDTETWYERSVVINGWQTIKIPNGCNFLAITLQFYDDQNDAVNTAFLYNKKVIESLETDIKNIQSQLEELKYYQKTTADAIQGVAHSFVVGQEPTENANTEYVGFIVQDLKNGDYIIPNVHTGSSYYAYAKIKDGKVVQIHETSREINTRINCDGSFDSLVFNHYLGYGRNYACDVYRFVSINNVIESLKKEATKTIKILCFGNSYTQDSMGCVPYILRNVAPNVNLTIGIGYIGGCALVQHCANFINESLELDTITYNVTPYTYYKSIPNQKAWQNKGSFSVDDLLADEDWDIVTFQQNGGKSDADWNKYYAPYIYKIQKALFSKVTKPIKIGWLLVHGSYASTFDALLEKYIGTAENAQKVQEFTGNQVVFPYGTAVQNLRTTPLVNLGDTGFLLADGGHLHEGIGTLTAAYANALVVLQLAGIDNKSIIGETTRPTKDWCTENNIPGPNYGEITKDVVGINDENCFLAQIAAIQAIKKPYEVTDCSAFVE